MNKNWKILTIVGVVGTVLLFSAGYFSGYVVHNQSTPISESELDNSSYSSQPVQVALTPRYETGNALKGLSDLEDIALSNSHFERAAALNKLLQNGTLESLPAYLEQSKRISSIHWRNTVQQALFHRIVTLDPMVALEQIDEMPIESRQPLIQVIFQEWSLVHLDQAIEQATQLDHTNKLSALEGILISTEHLPREERRAIARRLGNEWLALEKIELEKGLELFEDPEREWNDFLSHNNNNLDSLDAAQSKMLVFIATAWIARDGIEVFEEIRESYPPQYPLLETVSSIVNKLFPHHPQLALEMAAHVEGIGYRQREELVSEILTPWAEIAPQEALEAVNRIEGRYLRRLLQSLVLETWVAKDAKTFLGLIKNLPADLQGIAQEKALIAIAKSTPRDVVELLSEIKDRLSFLNVAEAIAIQWTQQDVLSALNWIEGDERLAAVQEHLMRRVITELSKIDPQLAFQTALSYPVDSDEEGFEVEVIAALAYQGDFDKAKSYLLKTRKGTTRDHAYQSLISALLFGEVGIQRSRDAVDLFLHAVTEDSVEYIGFMLMQISYKVPLMLFNSLDDLPTEELKREVARSLLAHNEDDGKFTEDQLAQLRELKQTQ